MSDRRKSLTGFRFFPGDLFIIAGAGALTWWLWHSGMLLWWIVPFVTGHFFLFCNVFRVRRSYELLWAICFILNVIYWLLQLDAGWNGPLLVQAPVTVTVIAAEMFSLRYHGIFAASINPRLGEYLQSRTDADASHLSP